MDESGLVKVDAQEATDVADMIEALMRQRGQLGDVTLYRAIVGLIADSRATQEADHG